MSGSAARKCDLPECHAPAKGQGRRYCCDGHSKIARNVANARSRAATAERELLRSALAGDTAPLSHVGFLAHTDGLVLTGQAVVELRALAAQLRGVAAAADQAFTRPVTSAELHTRVRNVRQAASQASAVIERLLA